MNVTKTSLINNKVVRRFDLISLCIPLSQMLPTLIQNKPRKKNLVFKIWDVLFFFSIIHFIINLMMATWNFVVVVVVVDNFLWITWKIITEIPTIFLWDMMMFFSFGCCQREMTNFISFSKRNHPNFKHTLFVFVVFYLDVSFFFKWSKTKTVRNFFFSTFFPFLIYYFCWP